MLTYFESRPQVKAFFKYESTISDVNNLKSHISSTTTIDAAVFVSKEEALSLYRAQNQDNPLLLEMVTADILPASLEVSANGDLEKIASIMQQDPLVEEVVFKRCDRHTTQVVMIR
jgi:cell division transport system permease protein